MPIKSTRAYGFTLVEILTVVTIVGLLAALLMPVYAKSVNKAHQTQCIGNLRQIGQAFSLYADDNDQFFPDQTDGRVQDNPTQTAITTDFETYLWPYTKKAEIFRCPSDTLSEPVVLPDVNKKLFNSYSTAWNVQGKASSAIPASSLTVLAGENMQLGSPIAFNWLIQQLGKLSFKPDPDIVYEQPDFRHTETGNYLYADGHVKSLAGPNPTFPGYQTSPQGVARCGRTDPLPQ